MEKERSDLEKTKFETYVVAGESNVVACESNFVIREPEVGLAADYIGRAAGERRKNISNNSHNGGIFERGGAGVVVPVRSKIHNCQGSRSLCWRWW